MSNYTDPNKVTGFTFGGTPRKGQTVSGYGGAIPTRYMLTYDGRRYRVKVMQYGNSGSAYIMVKGSPLFLDTDTEHRIMGA